ncbi:uncharacterized protein VNE69_08133 [Vairimorpha necatrix]|uniref:Uncharacterized protein n=1 Tax=Vairimorpha necatrix TaxID=6039 RepID=A0AAX4JEV3_9MICR
MIALKIFYYFYLVQSTKYFVKLNIVLNEQIKKKQYYTFDTTKGIYNDILMYEDVMSYISSTNKTKDENIMRAIEKIKSELFDKDNIDDLNNVLIYEKHDNDDYNKIIDGLIEYNYKVKNKENVFSYDIIVEKDSPTYKFIFDNNITAENVKFPKLSRPFLYNFVFKLDTIFYFTGINLKDLGIEEIFNVHLEKQFAYKNYNDRFLNLTLQNFNFFELNEVYGFKQYENTGIHEKRDLNDLDLKYHDFVILPSENIIKYKNTTKTIVFSYNKEFLNIYDDTKKNIVIDEVIYGDLLRLVKFYQKNQSNKNEINLLIRYISKNYPLKSLIESIYANKYTATYIFFEEIRTISKVLSRTDLNYIINNIDILKKASSCISGLHTKSNQIADNFIDFILYEDNNINYMIKICLIIEFEKHINNKNLDLRIFKTIKNISKLFESTNKDEVDIVLLFEELLNKKDVICEAIKSTWNDIFKAFLYLKNKKEEIN